jgi:hypothetical protein
VLLVAVESRLQTPDSSAGSATFARFLPDSIAYMERPHCRRSAEKTAEDDDEMMQRIFKKKVLKKNSKIKK